MKSSRLYSCVVVVALFAPIGAWEVVAQNVDPCDLYSAHPEQIPIGGGPCHPNDPQTCWSVYGQQPSEGVMKQTKYEEPVWHRAAPGASLRLRDDLMGNEIDCFDVWTTDQTPVKYSLDKLAYLKFTVVDLRGRTHKLRVNVDLPSSGPHQGKKAFKWDGLSGILSKLRPCDHRTIANPGTQPSEGMDSCLGDGLPIELFGKFVVPGIRAGIRRTDASSIDEVEVGKFAFKGR